MKQLEAHSVTIGDNVFYIRPFPAFKAANMSGELAALVLPMLTGVAPLLGGDNTDKSLFDMDLEAAAPTIAEAFSNLSGDKVEAILKHLLIAGKNVSYENPDTGKAVMLTEDAANEIFCTEVQNMFLLAFEVIRTNYAGFFTKLAAQFGSATPNLMMAAAR